MNPFDVNLVKRERRENAPIMMRFDHLVKAGTCLPARTIGRRKRKAAAASVSWRPPPSMMTLKRKGKKPARERDPNDYLSLSRSEPEQLAGSSGRLKMRSPHFKPVSEKGRAGGRARQPARPSAVSHSRVFETAVAIGVDSCEVGRVSSFYVPAGRSARISISLLHMSEAKSKHSARSPLNAKNKP